MAWLRGPAKHVSKLTGTARHQGLKLVGIEAKPARTLLTFEVRHRPGWKFLIALQPAELEAINKAQR